MESGIKRNHTFKEDLYRNIKRILNIKMQIFNTPTFTLKADPDNNASNRNTGTEGLIFSVLIIKKDTLDAAENRKAISRTE